MNETHAPHHATAFAVWSGLNFMSGTLLLISALLRETPMFWRDAGGFPVLLRELVLFLFYPGLILLGIGVLGSTWVAWRWRQNARLPAGIWITGAMQWLFLLTVIAIFAWNNLNNLFDGAPLHQHSP